mmetsp:Transcript_30741/g.46608  ORF Transcript_30741/g.46608 Transcript_30741/m.46608 type:complete len:407 (-) Transcript_30741:399-1619(-)|eukprot:CAMPEP_0178916658 /NCGR_PEP_ID=MMETSP0786-20121207/12779_1 /TAXON_ID=186022 /ORGANISM="Thalassionema frauenfeldii, Strain CCMP 1798" /LENGTH=406 /DNA_ID=CAMNT_0020590053 /DNA_START=107 /DNA_END=1327 /DNA_ORIENTATION=-
MPAVWGNKIRQLQSSDDFLNDEEDSSRDDILANGLFEISENDNFITEYSCSQLVQHNPFNLIEINFLYDLFSPATEDPELARQKFEFLLLQRVARHFGLQDGGSCLSPPVNDDIFMHMIQATSLPDDVPNDELGECLTPSISNHTCISYKGSFSIKILGYDDKNDVVDFIADSINNGLVTSGSSLKATFLGTKIEVSNNDILTSINTMEQPRIATPEDNKSITLIGFMLVVALSGSVLGFIFLVWNLRARKMRLSREKVFMATQGYPSSPNLSKDQQDSRQVWPDTMPDSSDGSEEKTPSESSASLPQNFGLDSFAAADNSFTNLDDVIVQNNKEPSYQFDLGNSMKSSLFGIHGHRPNPFFNDLESSSVADSDIDSWAQTDGTIGSLDERESIGVAVGDDNVGEI